MFFGIIIDVVIAAIILLGAVIGAKRGFIITVTKPVKWFAAIAFAFALCNVVAGEIIQPLIEAPLTNQLAEYLAEKCVGITSENLEEELPTLLKFAAIAVGVNLDSFEGESSAEIMVEIVDKLASPLVNLIAVIIAFVAVYILSKLLISLVILLLNKMFEDGILGVFNKILGLIFGAALAFVVAWLFVVIFGYVTSIPSIAQTEFIKSFDSGYIYNFFKSMSPLDLLLSF